MGNLKSRRPALERLEERSVPAALDLTTAGAGGSVNGALFQQVAPQPTGTGVIRSFVRIQPGGNAAVGQGHNTDARPLDFDENKSPQFTRSLKLSDSPIVITGGVAYREFLLDINQKASSPLVSLDELRIYLGAAGNLKGYDPTTHTLAGLTAAYDLDAGVNSTVQLNARLNSGSGSGDMTLLVPDAALTAASGDYVYLYSKFGATTASNGGFEEWAVKGTGSTLGSVSGHVYTDTDGSGTLNPGDSAVASVLIRLTWTSGGQTYTADQWTDSHGFYVFSGLTAGNYTVTVVSVPSQYEVPGTTPTTKSVDVTVGEIDRNNDFVLVLDTDTDTGGGGPGPGGPPQS